jgi:hypothetical protein
MPLINNIYMKKIQFPDNLTTDNEVSSRYGNNFMVIYINEPNQDDSVRYTNSSGAQIQDVNGIQTKNTRIANSFSFLAGGTFLDRSSGDKVTTTHTIFLPVPIGLKTNYGVSYGTLDITKEGLKIGSGLLSVGSGLVGKIIAARSGKVAGDAFASAIGQGTSAVQAVLPSIGAYTGLSLNPHSELLFEGVKFREFEFTYKLIAKTSQESERIQEIVNLLRFHMHPELDGKSFLFRYPSDFDITFYTKNSSGGVLKNKYLPFVMTSVLTGIDVNYSGSNNFVTFKDTSAPVEVDLTLKFKETQILTKEVILAVQKSIDENKEVASSSNVTRDSTGSINVNNPNPLNN